LWYRVIASIASSLISRLPIFSGIFVCTLPNRPDSLKAEPYLFGLRMGC
jgi:hypothetical protein